MLLYHIHLLSCSSAKLSPHLYKHLVGRNYILLICVSSTELSVWYCEFSDATSEQQCSHNWTPGSPIHRTKYKYPFPLHVGELTRLFTLHAQQVPAEYN